MKYNSYRIVGFIVVNVVGGHLNRRVKWQSVAGENVAVGFESSKENGNGRVQAKRFHDSRFEVRQAVDDHVKELLRPRLQALGGSDNLLVESLLHLGVLRHFEAAVDNGAAGRLEAGIEEENAAGDDLIVA